MKNSSTKTLGRIKIYLFILIFSCIFSPLLKADIVLNFGVYTSDKPTEMIKKFRPAMNYLQQKMTLATGEKVTIKIQVAKSYQQGLYDLVSGKVDFSRFGPASYILAKEQDNNISIIAIESKKGKKQFFGLICAASNSPINSIKDLNNKRFAFGNKRSTIGRYLAQTYLLNEGIKANNLKQYKYLGRHDKVAMAVANGQYDAGALKEGTYTKLVKKGVQLKVLAKFPNVTKPWIASSQLDKTLLQKLRTILLETTDKKVLKSLSKDGFLIGNDKDYQIIRESMADNFKFFES
ncbi:MAG: PhnD/SsuA/transferrin family substrate-binding protein [Pseudomonadota bacterium]